jgi:hypothetical protein
VRVEFNKVLENILSPKTSNVLLKYCYQSAALHALFLVISRATSRPHMLLSHLKVLKLLTDYFLADAL